MSRRLSTQAPHASIVLTSMFIFLVLRNYYLQVLPDRPLTTAAAARNNTFQDFPLSYLLEDYKLPQAYKAQLPSKDVPFIFFHQRKAGGTTMSSQIFKAAQNISLPVFIPCFAGIPCETYQPPQTTNFSKIPAIYGGHLYYSGLMRTLTLHHNNNRHGNTATLKKYEPQYTCFTSFRSPISRIQSCW